jgi:hypothetical protein
LEKAVNTSDIIMCAPLRKNTKYKETSKPSVIIAYAPLRNAMKS